MNGNKISSTTIIRDIAPHDINVMDEVNRNFALLGFTVFSRATSSTIFVSEDAARVIVARLTEILADLPAKVEAA